MSVEQPSKYDITEGTIGELSMMVESDWRVIKRYIEADPRKRSRTPRWQILAAVDRLAILAGKGINGRIAK